MVSSQTHAYEAPGGFHTPNVHDKIKSLPLFQVAPFHFCGHRKWLSLKTKLSIHQMLPVDMSSGSRTEERDPRYEHLVRVHPQGQGEELRHQEGAQEEPGEPDERWNIWAHTCGNRMELSKTFHHRPSSKIDVAMTY